MAGTHCFSRGGIVRAMMELLAQPSVRRSQSNCFLRIDDYSFVEFVSLAIFALKKLKGQLLYPVYCFMKLIEYPIAKQIRNIIVS
jgi:hypothetical protein